MFWEALFWFVFALIFACLEIEAEGKYGWAEKAPTWYRTTGFLAKLYGKVMMGKPMTGYHTFTFFVPVMIFHSKFVMGIQWTLGGEFMAWAMYFAWCPLWDFLWFVLNPHYGIRNFKRGKIWWHSKRDWIGPVPLDYILGWALSIVLAASPPTFLGQGGKEFVAHFYLLGYFAIFIVITIFAIAPIYKYWYRRMRQGDDRDKVGIFHKE